AGSGNSGSGRPTTSTRAGAASWLAPFDALPGVAPSPGRGVSGTRGRTASPCELGAPRISGWVSAWLLTSATVSQDLVAARAHAPARRVPARSPPGRRRVAVGHAAGLRRRRDGGGPRRLRPTAVVSPARGGARPRRPRAGCPA